MALANKVIYQNGAIREFEKPEVCEAIKVANANKWIIGLSPIEWNEREKRLKKEHEKNNKESAHDKKSMTLEEAKNLLEKEGFSFYKRISELCTVPDHFKRYENPKICKAMDIVNSAGYCLSMGSSLFDERKARLKKEYEESRKKEENPSLTFEEAKKFAKKDLEEHMERLISRKKERKEENPALKESASQFNDALLDEQGKENKRLRKKITRLGKIIHKKEQMVKDKDAVLSDVAEELRLTKIREKNLAELGLKYVGENEKLKKELADKVVDKIDAQALKSAESALAWKEKTITYKDMALAYYEKKIAEKDEVIADLGKELAEAKKLNTAKILDINAKCMRAARESINDVFESYAAKYAKSTLDELKDKAYETFNAKAHKLGLVGSKDGKGIPDQMISVDIAEEGGDHSGVIVLCGTDFVKMLKENEDFIHDLFGKKHKEIKEFMSAEAERLFEGDGISTKMEVMKPSRKFKKIK